MYFIEREDIRKDLPIKVTFKQFLNLYDFTYWNSELSNPLSPKDREDTSIIRIYFLNNTAAVEWFEIGLDGWDNGCLSDDYLETIFNKKILDAVVSKFCYDEQLELFAVYLC